MLVNVYAIAYSQKPNDKGEPAPIMKFTETTHDFGTITEDGGKVSCTFELTNAGTADLFIDNVQGSCGCAVPEWSKPPIAPGQKGFVKVTFNPANRPGAFTKTVKVKSNCSDSPTTLTIQGNVVRAPESTGSLKPGSDGSQSLLTIEQVIKDAREGVEFIGNEELISRIDANPKLVLLDVRTKEEYDAGHLKGATWIERGVAEFTLARTLRDADAEIIVYCLKGNRSALVVKALKRVGYRNVKSYSGLEDWFKAGLPVYNFLGEVKMIELRKLNAATNPVEFYLEKK